jgi:hypothetical protein
VAEQDPVEVAGVSERAGQPDPVVVGVEVVVADPVQSDERPPLGDLDRVGLRLRLEPDVGDEHPGRVSALRLVEIELLQPEAGRGVADDGRAGRPVCRGGRPQQLVLVGPDLALAGGGLDDAGPDAAVDALLQLPDEPLGQLVDARRGDPGRLWRPLLTEGAGAHDDRDAGGRGQLGEQLRAPAVPGWGAVDQRADAVGAQLGERAVAGGAHGVVDRGRLAGQLAVVDDQVLVGQDGAEPVPRERPGHGLDTHVASPPPAKVVP